MSVSVNGGVSAYRIYPYVYYTNGFIPTHNMMFFGQIDRNTDGRHQFFDDRMYGREMLKDRMGPPMYPQKKGHCWAAKRSFRGGHSPPHMSPAPSECESDDSGRSSTTSNSTHTFDVKVSGMRYPYEMGPQRVNHNHFSRFLNVNEPGPPSYYNTAVFQNKRRYDGSRASIRGHRPFPHNHHNHSFSIAPDRYLMRSQNVEVKGIPEKLITDSKWDKLSSEIWNKFIASQQKEVTFKNKMNLWRFLYCTIKEAHPRYSLYLVGSTISGFGADHSDMDLCLLVRALEPTDTRTQALMHLDTVMDVVKKTEKFVQVEMINAKVPILKFRDGFYSLEVDLNCNNVVGIRNTSLLNCYSQLDWRVRPLVLTIKLWAQHEDINDPKNKTISSYSLVLMVLHYLQCGVSPPVLPCLQAEFPEKFDANRDIHDIDMFERMPPFESKNDQSLGELLSGFMEYYTNFDYAQNTISVRTGTCLSVKQCRSNRRFEPHQWKLLCVEEPFDLSNTARSVYDPEVFEHILQVFEKSSQALIKCPALASLLPP